jgi:hypothetical protein
MTKDEALKKKIMFKLVILYTNGSSETKQFKTWEEADWYAHMGGDHVSDYTITEEKNT